MIRMLGLGALLAVTSLGLTPAETAEVTWTGWFSDAQCARVKPGETPRPNGTVCVKKCLDEGSAAVFISEQAKDVYQVRDYSTARDDVGYYLEITGEVDEKTKTVSVKSVKRLSAVASTCALPPRVIKK